MSLALLLTAAATAAVGTAALCATHKLRHQVAALRVELASDRAATPALVPQARSATTSDEIRTAVAEALAEEHERDMAEARAFWAAQEARDAADTPSLLGESAGPGLGVEENSTPFFYVPRQADLAGLEALDLDSAESLDDFPSVSDESEADEFPPDFAELAAARRRHPSHPDFVPVRPPVIADHERTVAQVEALAETRTALADVRPGPLGTLDVYVFTDGTTLCLTPGHRETAERLAEALREGETPYLLGGSGVAGAYALTFSCGNDGTSGNAEDHVYILADRVIASI